MNILAVDMHLDIELFQNESFGSSVSFLDFDVIVWNPNLVLSGYSAQSSNSTYRGLKNLNDYDSASIQNDMERRKNELIDMFKLGRIVIVITPPPIKCFVDSGKREYSGTGRNRATTRIVNEIDLLSVLNIEINTMAAEGQSLEFRGDNDFKQFYDQIKNIIGYEAYFQEPIGKPFLYIKGTNKVIGTSINIDNGKLIFIPSLFYNEDSDESELENLYAKSIIELITKLKESTGNFELPKWSENYSLPNEKKLNDNLLKLEKKLNQTLRNISKEKEKINKLKELKILITGTGKALEVIVKRVFKDIGFQIEERPPGRDDVLISYKDKVAVVEIKGVTKSSAEKHAAQLEKWVSEYYATEDVMPKGILIVNAYKDVPLLKRKEDPFPHQMLKYSENRNHCLLTGAQLLSLYFKVLEDPSTKEQVINIIFNTSGILNNELIDINNIILYRDDESYSG